MDPRHVPVFILAGGFGTRIKEETEFRPKPMVPIGDHPILWHIMRKYSAHGFARFVVCAGFKAQVIKEYFLNYDAFNSDFTVNLNTRGVEFHGCGHSEGWRVTIADTGIGAMTGARIARAARRYLGDAEHFAVTYGDGLTDADLGAELRFHLAHGRIGTVLGITPPSRFGEFVLGEGDVVTEFREKPEDAQAWINGGFFFFRREFVDYLPDGREDLIFEKEPLMGLASDRQLFMYRHRGFWQCMDTQRDREYLEHLLRSGTAPWLRSGAGQAR
jgi:glucose-1-phosphate cytidylyltransferase